MKFIKDNKHKFVLLLLWIFAFFYIFPIGEFPINDDWAYAKNIYNFVVNGKFIVDEWPAMNLISQTIYGSFFVAIFGFSFTILRISMLILAIISSIILYNIVFLISNKNGWISFFITFIFCFNPIFFSLSFTFMTDVFFISFLIFSLNQLLKFYINKSYINYFLFILFSVIAVLNRQQGLLFSFLMVGVVFKIEKNKLKAIILSAIPILLCWLAHDKYRHFLVANGISNGIQNTKHFIEYLKIANPFDHIIHLGDALFVNGLILSPLILLILVHFKNYKLFKSFIFALIICLITIATYNVWQIFPLGNVSKLAEIGPKIVKKESIKAIPLLIKILQVLFTIVSFISICFVVFVLFIRKNISNLFSKNIFASLPFIIVCSIYFLFIIFSKAYFDRYDLPMALLLILILIPQKFIITKISKIIILIIICMIYLTSITETKDFFNWQKNRWVAINYLHKKGISSHEIDGGFEYNGWYKTNNKYPNDERSWWWVEKDNYIISTEKLRKYNTDTLFIFQNYLPFRKDTIYVLKKQNLDTSN